jgi:uroporphyrinogen-III synthase
MKLLILRPQPGADATAALATKAGIETDIAPLFEVQSVVWTAPRADQYDALLLTSANALRHGGNQMAAFKNLPVYAVGSATADAARGAGLGVIWTGTKSADSVIAQAKADRNLRLLWLTGRHHIVQASLPELTIDAKIVYDSVQITDQTTLVTKLSRPCLAALHSARSAQCFMTICDTHAVDKSSIAIAAYSQKIADTAGPGWAASLVADAPNDEALLFKAKSYFTNAHCDP